LCGADRAFDTSGKSEAYRHRYKNYYTARAGKPAAGVFTAGPDSTRAVSICLIFFVAVSLKFDTSGKSLA
jgi:hypothetical protein